MVLIFVCKGGRLTSSFHPSSPLIFLSTCLGRFNRRLRLSQSWHILPLEHVFSKDYESVRYLHGLSSRFSRLL